MSPVLTAVVGIVVLLVLLGLVVITRYKVAGPSEAFIITGRRGKQTTDPTTGRVFTDNSGQKVVVGGGWGGRTGATGRCRHLRRLTRQATVPCPTGTPRRKRSTGASHSSKRSTSM
ncbi:hypothetical protein GCM10017562_75450 [Streptomyces roseofulvus]